MIWPFTRLFPRPRQRTRCGEPEWDEQAFEPDDPRIPGLIREGVERSWQTGFSLVFMDSDLGGEWWVLDEDSEIVDVVWIE